MQEIPRRDVRTGAAVARVTLITDQLVWARDVADALVVDGFAVVTDDLGGTAFDQDARRTADVVVVDLRIRRQSGLALCAAVRARSDVPIFAIVHVDDDTAVLSALAAGADRVASSDASPRSLIARIRALLRRSSVRPALVSPAESGDLLIDEAAGVVIVSGTAVRLSPQELTVMRTLMSRPDRVVTRAELTSAWPTAPGDRRLDFVIRRLRQKLESVEGRRRISVVRGVGFRFESDRAARRAT